MEAGRAAVARELGGASHQRGTEAFVAMVGMHHRIEQEGVHRAVPGDVDVADELTVAVGAEVDEAPAQHVLEVVDLLPAACPMPRRIAP